MFRTIAKKSDQKGATLVEFAIGGSVFLLALFALIEFGRLLWTHNALNDAARRAARYAVNQPASSPPGVETTTTQKNVGPKITEIQNVAVYGDPAGGSQPLVNNLTTNNVDIYYTNFGLGSGTVAVEITGYQFQFVLPFIGTTITMPDYLSTISGENAGVPP